MSEQKSLWEPEPDIFTDYEGTVTEATFKFNEFGGQFSLTFDEIDGRPDKPTWENYKLPPGWESNDGGETIERTSGDGKGFVKSSQYMKFLMAVKDLPGAFEAVGGELAAVNANAWIGCRFRMEVTEAGKGKPYNSFEKDGQTVPGGVGKDKNYPTAFLGKDQSGNVTGSHTTNGKVDSLSVLTTLNNPVVESQIQELAKTTDHPKWFRESFSMITEIGVTAATHPDLVSALGGRELYESLGGKG